MKSLPTLIRLKQQQLDEKRVVLTRLETEAASIRATASASMISQGGNVFRSPGSIAMSGALRSRRRAARPPLRVRVGVGVSVIGSSCGCRAQLTAIEYNVNTKTRHIHVVHSARQGV